jgi:hypothetical protein
MQRYANRSIFNLYVYFESIAVTRVVKFPPISPRRLQNMTASLPLLNKNEGETGSNNEAGLPRENNKVCVASSVYTAIPN